MIEIPENYKTMTGEEMMALSAAQRIMIGCKLNQDYREEILASFPPGLSEIETKLRLCERLYGDKIDLEGFARYLREREKIDKKKTDQSP